jgi:hypothetical protein
LIYAKNHDIFSTNLKAIPKGELVDGAPLVLKKKELGRTDIFPLVNIFLHSLRNIFFEG